jgi:hypothetical protein
MAEAITENKTENTAAKSVPQTANMQPEKQILEQPHSLPKKTTGEKYYDVFQFLTGKAFIIAITAVLAFAAHPKYAEDKYFGVPNYLKKFQIWFKDKLLNNKALPLADRGEYGTRLAAALASTMTLFHGGNLFAPMLKWLENDREKISTYFNKKFGKPGEVEAGHERLKDLPHQTWGDVAKGRAVAFTTVATSFITADAVLGKDSKTKRYWFDKYEDWFGRKVAGLTKAGKEIAATPMAVELTEEQLKNRTYRFGKIIALDLYATSAAIIIWNTISRLSAKKRAHKQRETSITEDVAASMGLPDSIIESDEARRQHHFADPLMQRSRSLKQEPAPSHLAKVDQQRQTSEAKPSVAL